MNPVDELAKGVLILDRVMLSNGFKYVAGTIGTSSGGLYASGSYEKANRKLGFSIRYSLGCVDYQIGKEKISHTEYLRVINARGKYPGFSNEIKVSFQNLAEDIEKYGSVFLNGTDLEFNKIIELSKNKPKKSGFGALS